MTDRYHPVAMAQAEQQMRLVLLGTGALTLDQVDRHAPGLTRAVVGAYLGAADPTGRVPA